jgi:hypothetical protein
MGRVSPRSIERGGRRAGTSHGRWRQRLASSPPGPLTQDPVKQLAEEGIPWATTSHLTSERRRCRGQAEKGAEPSRAQGRHAFAPKAVEACGDGHPRGLERASEREVVRREDRMGCPCDSHAREFTRRGRRLRRPSKGSTAAEGGKLETRASN